MIADQNGCRLLAARVHDGDHVHVFVSAPPKVAIPVKFVFSSVFPPKCCSKSSLKLKFSFGVGVCGLRDMLLGLRATLLAQRLKNTSTESDPTKSTIVS
jgi:hypothetical protein